MENKAFDMMKILDMKSQILKNQKYLPCYEKYCSQMEQKLVGAENENYEIKGQNDEKDMRTLFLKKEMEPLAEDYNKCVLTC